MPFGCEGPASSLPSRLTTWARETAEPLVAPGKGVSWAFLGMNGLGNRERSLLAPVSGLLV